VPFLPTSTMLSTTPAAMPDGAVKVMVIFCPEILYDDVTGLAVIVCGFQTVGGVKPVVPTVVVQVLYSWTLPESSAKLEKVGVGMLVAGPVKKLVMLATAGDDVVLWATTPVAEIGQ
jgi:hypothetical protein